MMYEDGCQAVSGENNYIWQFSFFHCTAAAFPECACAMRLIANWNITHLNRNGRF
jgi:hypothetical protein